MFVSSFKLLIVAAMAALADIAIAPVRLPSRGEWNDHRQIKIIPLRNHRHLVPRARLFISGVPQKTCIHINLFLRVSILDLVEIESTLAGKSPATLQTRRSAT